ncbi:MAG: hypothetical protein H7255_12860 [Ramlibacter sp.]|nr:hypothetical protein [Ramlibacter sp.]
MTQYNSAPDAVGTEYLWWRTEAGMRTTVALFKPGLHADSARTPIEAALFDREGRLVATWKFDLTPERACIIDSAAEGPWTTAKATDGVLALHVFEDTGPGSTQTASNTRLYPLVTWRRPDGRVASLHSDQCLSRGSSQPQRFTEIVVSERADEHNALVLLNGETRQPSDALVLQIQNVRGDVRSARYTPTMDPFTVHRVALLDLFPDIVDFSAQGALLVSGTFHSLDLETRPYAETTGRRWGLYHGGDVYTWGERPFIKHAYIDGEVNPMAVIHNDRVSTWVNLLHSHDGMDGDTDIDVRLFDDAGTCVASRHRWKTARRQKLTRFAVAELLDDPSRPFNGHIAISFAPEPGQPVPFHVQALMEYGSDRTVARVMGWSDEWNSDVKRARRLQLGQDDVIRACFLVWNDAELESLVAITNAGHLDYKECATAELSLVGPSGTIMKTELSIGPYATAFFGISEKFPEWSEHLDAGTAMLVISSRSDLASLAFIRHRESGAVAAEHFFALWDWTGTRITEAAGS